MPEHGHRIAQDSFDPDVERLLRQTAAFGEVVWLTKEWVKVTGTTFALQYLKGRT